MAVNSSVTSMVLLPGSQTILKLPAQDLCQLLDELAALVSDHGKIVGAKEIADRYGISKQTLYQYWSRRSEIRDAIGARA